MSEILIRLIFVGFLLALAGCEPPQQQAAPAEAPPPVAEKAPDVPAAQSKPDAASASESAGAVEAPEAEGSTPATDVLPQIADTLQTGPRPGKPHGAYDPHATLDPERMAKVALQHRAEGRMPEAMQTLNEAIGRFPEDAELRSVRGSLLLEQGQVTDALEDFESSLSMRPDDARTLVNRSQAYRQFGRDDEALGDLDRAVELEPDFIAARFNRGVIHQELGQYEKALADFEHCVAVDPHSAAPYFNRAAAYDALGDRYAAVADLEHFVELAENEEWKKAATDILKAWEDQAGKVEQTPRAGSGADQAQGQ